MSSLSPLPQIDYFCIFKEHARTKSRKGHKQLSFSDRYEFTGTIDIDCTTYRLQFTSYQDVAKLITGVYPSKQTHRALYEDYIDGIVREERTYFSPVIAQTGARIGEAAEIHKDDFIWLPYVVLSMRDKFRVEMDFMAIEAQTDSVISVMALNTEPGQIIMRQAAKTRWLWRRPASAAMAA